MIKATLMYSFNSKRFFSGTTFLSGTTLLCGTTLFSDTDFVYGTYDFTFDVLTSCLPRVMKTYLSGNVDYLSELASMTAKVI